MRKHHVIRGLSRGTILAIVFLLFLFMIITPLLNLKDDQFSLITGDATSSAYVIQKYSKSCNISLYSGWNLISSYCRPNNRDLDVVLAQTGNTIISVHSRDELDTTDPWKIYNPHLPSWVEQDLSKFQTYQGYWIRANYSSYLNIDGDYLLPSFISMHEGWNLVGYPSNETSAVNISLWSIADEYNVVYAYDALSSRSYVFYKNNPGATNMTFMVPLYAYWINMSTNKTWQVS